MDSGLPCFPPGFSCPAVLWILLAAPQFRLRDFYPLWFTFPGNSTIKSQYGAQSSTPKVLLLLVWPLSLSLAATQKISFDFSSSAYLDVSVQRVSPPATIYSLQVDRVLLCRVSPFGNLRVYAYLQLSAAYRSLSRPSSAPDAKAFSMCSSSLDLRRHRFRFLSSCLQLLLRFTVPPLSHKSLLLREP